MDPLIRIRLILWLPLPLSLFSLPTIILQVIITLPEPVSDNQQTPVNTMYSLLDFVSICSKQTSKSSCYGYPLIIYPPTSPPLSTTIIFVQLRQAVIRWTSIVICAALLVFSLLVLSRYRRLYGSFKAKVILILFCCALTLIISAVCDFFGIYLFQLKFTTMTFAYCLIIQFMIKKVPNTSHERETPKPKNRSKKIVWISMIALAIINLLGSAWELIYNIMGNQSCLSIKLLFGLSSVPNAILLSYLLLVSRMVRCLKEQSIQSFKFNPRTLQNLHKNLYMIQNMTMFIISFSTSIFTKISLNIYIVFRSAKSQLHSQLVPANFPQRQLVNELIILLGKIIIFYTPVLYCVKLFKHRKDPAKSRRVGASSGGMIINSFNGTVRSDKDTLYDEDDVQQQHSHVVIHNQRGSKENLDYYSRRV